MPKRRKELGCASKTGGENSSIHARGPMVSRIGRTDVSCLGEPTDYGDLLEEIKNRIRAARIKAVLSVNRELIVLYWYIGAEIVKRQRNEGWGKSVVDRLSRDLQSEFPDYTGFSPQNIWHMRAFYLAWTEEISILPQPAGEFDGLNLPPILAQIPWFHNVVLIEKVKHLLERIWYAKQIIEHGWSRAVLVHQIELNLYERQGKAVTNFERSLPPYQSDLAQQSLKDPYVFDFLTFSDDAAERKLERGLVDQIRNFLLELGIGFAFVGVQLKI